MLSQRLRKNNLPRWERMQGKFPVCACLKKSTDGGWMRTHKKERVICPQGPSPTNPLPAAWPDLLKGYNLSQQHH